MNARPEPERDCYRKDFMLFGKLIAACAAAFLFLAAPALAQTSDPENTLLMQLKDGTVTIQLRPDLAPNHVARLKELARKGFYDGVVFHRVIDGFMAQTGDPTGTGTGGSDLPDLKAEFTNTHFGRGVIGMARTRDPDSANSQFFIMYGDADLLNGHYTVFGEVVSGMEFVDNIKKGDRGQQRHGRWSRQDRQHEGRGGRPVDLGREDGGYHGSGKHASAGDEQGAGRHRNATRPRARPRGADQASSPARASMTGSSSTGSSKGSWRRPEIRTPEAAPLTAGGRADRERSSRPSSPARSTCAARPRWRDPRIPTPATANSSSASPTRLS